MNYPVHVVESAHYLSPDVYAKSNGIADASGNIKGTVGASPKNKTMITGGVMVRTHNFTEIIDPMGDCLIRVWKRGAELRESEGRKLGDC